MAMSITATAHLFLGRTIALAIVLSFASARSAAHDDIRAQIEAVTARISESPDDAHLFLKRGQLYQLRKAWKAGLADFDRAARLEPSLDSVDLARGRLLFDAGRPKPAEVSLNRFLRKHADAGAAWLTLARVHRRLGRHAEAALDFTRAIDHLNEPKPGHYLERARALAALGDDAIDLALRGLDDGIHRLGLLVTLQTYAIKLNLRVRDYDAALQRLETISARSRRKERWLAYRGDILMSAGRNAAARGAYERALAAIGILRPRHRMTKAVRVLDEHIRAALASLVAGKANPSIPKLVAKADGK